MIGVATPQAAGAGWTPAGGLARSPPAADNSTRSAWRMRAMMKRLDVNLLELCYDGLGATFETARHACGQCASADACELWLGSGQSAEAPEFCPNLTIFERFNGDLTA